MKLESRDGKKYATDCYDYLLQKVSIKKEVIDEHAMFKYFPGTEKLAAMEL